VVFGQDDQAAAGAGAGTIAGRLGTGVFGVYLEQGPLKLLEGVLANAAHQGDQRNPAGAQQTAQVGLRNGGEAGQQALPLCFRYEGWPLLVQVLAELVSFGALG